MPMLMTLRIGSPVCPRHSPLRTRSENDAMRSRTSWTCLTTSSPSTISERSRGIRRATWRTARSSVELMCSPRNIASRRSATPHSVGQGGQQREGLVGDPVLRVVEVEADGLGGQALAALGIGGEQVAQVRVADLCVVPLERP